MRLTIIYYFSSFILGIGFFFAFLPHTYHHSSTNHSFQVYLGIGIGLLGLLGMLLTAKK